MEKLGEGGMGEVFRGIDLALEREVAIKSLRPELTHDQNLVERFRMEAVALARLNHPNIVTLHNFFHHDNQYFMVLEFIHGETLDKIIKRHGAIPWQRAVFLIKDTLNGLAHAHKLQVIHRDIKPANIILTPAGALKLMDFGIARILKTSRLTRTGHFFGTLQYMSPEQIQGRDADARSDIYSVGIVLYEMLTGHIPFDRNTDYELIKSQVEEPPLPPRTLAPQIPQLLEEAVLHALAKAPSDRFQSAIAFLDMLDTITGKKLPDHSIHTSDLVKLQHRFKHVFSHLEGQDAARRLIKFVRGFPVPFFIKRYPGFIIALVLIGVSMKLVGIEHWQSLLQTAIDSVTRNDQLVEPRPVAEGKPSSPPESVPSSAPGPAPVEPRPVAEGKPSSPPESVPSSAPDTSPPISPAEPLSPFAPTLAPPSPVVPDEKDKKPSDTVRNTKKDKLKQEEPTKSSKPIKPDVGDKTAAIKQPQKSPSKDDPRKQKPEPRSGGSQQKPNQLSKPKPTQLGKSEKIDSRTTRENETKIDRTDVSKDYEIKPRISTPMIPLPNPLPDPEPPIKSKKNLVNPSPF